MWHPAIILIIWASRHISEVCSDNPMLERQQIQSYHSCQTDVDCPQRWSFCYGNDDNRRGKCKCLEGYELFRNTTYYECLPASQLGKECLSNFQCTTAAGYLAFCNKSNICECDKTAHGGGDGLCHISAKIGEVCMSDENCFIDKTSCFEARCACPPEYKGSMNKMTCIPAKLLGEKCNKDEECLDNAVCNDVCRCNGAFIQSRDNSRCLQAATIFGAPCIENGQCDKFLSKSICTNGSCACQDDFHDYGTKCLATRKTGERCQEDGECVFNPKLQKSVKCSNNVCKCVNGITDDELGCKLVPEKGSSTNLEPFRALLLVLCTLHCIFLLFNR